METKQILLEFGATAFAEEYSGDGRIKMLAFKLDNRSYRIPSHDEGVYEILYSNKRHRGNDDTRRKSAYNISWRIIRDWCHAQVSMMRMGQAKPDEILLPYMWDGKRSFYEAYKEGRLKLEQNKEDDGE